MSRWKVVMQTYPPECGLFGARGKTWEVFTPDRTFAARFRTHAEALAYADRRARTREYVLPRPDKDGDIATADEQVAWENTEFESNFASVAWIEEPGTIGLSTASGDHYMTTDGALSIALALAALAEMEGVK